MYTFSYSISMLFNSSFTKKFNPNQLLCSIWSVNFKSAVNISQVVAKKMIEDNKEGSIVNVSSQASIKPIHNHTSYCASKAAMDHVGRVMALELGPKKVIFFLFSILR